MTWTPEKNGFVCVLSNFSQAWTLHFQASFSLVIFTTLIRQPFTNHENRFFMRNPAHIVNLKKLLHEDVFDPCKPSMKIDVHDIGAVLSEVFFRQEYYMGSHFPQVSRYNHARKPIVHELFLVHLPVKVPAQAAEPPATHMRPSHLVSVAAERMTGHSRPQAAEFSLFSGRRVRRKLGADDFR
jgi:hypothetical protein